MSTPPPAAALASSAAAPAAAPIRHLKICFNSYCKDPKSEPSRKKGWRLRSGEQAELCDRCFCSYEQGTFCETFHSDAAGWRNCESCGKRVHCGCIVSAPAYMLLDGGGIECVACAKKGLITAPKQLWPSQLLLPVQVSERPKEFPVKARNQMAGSVPGQWRQASNMWNMGVQSELHQRLAFEFDRPSSIEKLLSAARSSLASQDKKIEDLPDRVTSGNLNHVTRDRYANGAAGLNSVSGFSAYSGGGKTESLHDSGFHGGENDPMFTRKGADPCSTSSGVNHETHPNSCAKSLSPPVLKEDSASPLIALATPCSLPGDTKDLDRISTDQPHRQAASPLGRPMYPNSSNVIDSCGELQAMRNGKPRGDLRARTQLLLRYWPRSTDQELQQIFGDTNAVITPLFEKMLSASDAGRIGRLVLPKRCAETYFPSIGSPEGVPLKVQDIAGNEWTFQFRYWPNNNSRMYVLEGVTACIQSMQLQAGDTVIFSRMDPEGKLVMGHRKASSMSTEQDNQASKSGNGSATPPEANNKNISADIIPSLPHRPLKGCTESPNPINTTDQGALSKSDKPGFILKNGPVAKSSAPSKRKGSTPGSKSKRLRIDHEDSIQLKLTWEAAQDLLRPPPNGVPSVVFIEGHEFEEYEVVLNNATQETNNPAYYALKTFLLSTDPEAAKDVVLAEKPVISDDSNQLDPSLLDELLANIATLSSVYHKPPDAFVSRAKLATPRQDDDDYPDEADTGNSESPSHAVDGARPPPSTSTVSHASVRQPAPASLPSSAPVPDLLGDLMGMDNAIVPVDQPTTPSGPPLPVLLPSSTGQGLQISAQLTRCDGQVFYSILFENNTQVVLDGFMIQFNKNTFGLAAAGPLQVPPLQPGTSARTLLPMVLFQDISPGSPNTLLQVAIKNNQQPVWYFNDKISFHVFFMEDGRMERSSFLETWKSLPDTNEVAKDLIGTVVHNVDATVEQLAASNVFFIAKRRNANKEILYLSTKIPRGILFMIELTMAVGVPGVKCAIKTPSPELAPLFFEAMETILK